MHTCQQNKEHTGFDQHSGLSLRCKLSIVHCQPLRTALAHRLDTFLCPSWEQYLLHMWSIVKRLLVHNHHGHMSHKNCFERRVLNLLGMMSTEYRLA
jgi:hypothetical protein